MAHALCALQVWITLDTPTLAYVSSAQSLRFQTVTLDISTSGQAEAAGEGGAAGELGGGGGGQALRFKAVGLSGGTEDADVTGKT